MPRLPRIVFGVADLLSACLVALGVFGGLPDRWWPVDAPALLVVALLVVAGTGLLAEASWARTAALVSSAVVLGVGLGLVAALALTASYLNGIYGPVGRGGAVIVTLVGALAVPYLVVLPSVQLVWLRKPGAEPPRPRVP